MVKFKLTNKTQWDTRALRKLCNLTIKAKGSEHKRHRIYVMHSKRGNYHGRASLGGNWIEMYVPTPQTIARHRIIKLEKPVMTKRRMLKRYKRQRIMKSRLFEPIVFAQILAHEIDHNLSLRHEEMASAWSFDADYAKEIFVEPCYPKPKPKIDHVQVRHERAIKNLKKAQTRHKRATTLLKKWQKKVRYYEERSASPS